MRCHEKKGGKKSATKRKLMKSNFYLRKRSKATIPKVSVVKDRMGGRSENCKSELVMIIDETVLNEDFIPLSCPGTSTENEEVKHHKAKSYAYSMPKTEEVNATIVIDDDMKNEVNDKQDSDANKSALLNNSIEIIVEKSAKRKTNMQCKSYDDSIEICQEIVNKPMCKKAKSTPSCSKSPGQDINILKQPLCTSNRNEKDDDIVIIDSFVKRDSVIVLEDIPPTRFPSTHLNNKKKKKAKVTKESNTYQQKLGYVNPDVSLVFEDTSGASPKKSAKYKSPLLCVDSSNLDSETSYFSTYGKNICNPNPNKVEKTGLRPVIIDGSNVAFGHGGDYFSTRGLEICINYFVKRGHMVVAFIPLFRRTQASESDKKILDGLQTKRLLSFTPSRFLNGRRVASYDDRFIVQCAAELSGVIVSTDNYRDLVMENEAWRETIEKRLLMFTWVGDILMFPDDPNGRAGPRLEEFLRFPQ